MPCRKIVVLLVFAALAQIGAQGSVALAGEDSIAIEDTGSTFEITVPASRVIVTVPKGHLSISRPHGDGGGAASSPRYFSLEDVRSGTVVSGWFEPAESYRDFEATWKEQMEQQKLQMEKVGEHSLAIPQNVERTEIGPWRVIFYSFPLRGGANSHAVASYVGAGTWIDLHVSITSAESNAEVRQQVLALMKSLQVREKPVEKLGKIQADISELERSQEAEESALGRYTLALAYEGRGDSEKAVEALRRSVALKSDFPPAWAKLVLSLFAAKRGQEAIQAVQEARLNCPSCDSDAEFSGPMSSIAQTFHESASRAFEAGAVDLAEAGHKVALLFDPRLADAHYNLGVLAVAKGETSAAEGHYRQALALCQPEEAELAADARNNLAYLLLGKSGAGAEAVILIRQAIAVRGEEPAFLDTLARACDAAGDPTCALEAYRKLLAASDEAVPPEALEHAKERVRALGG